MNAPAPAAHMVEQQLEWLPRTAIALSASAFQQRRRQRFTDASLVTLIESVRASGIVVPLLVRPMPDGTLHHLDATHELVAGERRYLAAQAAGLAHVPAIIRDISDEELLVVQLTENKDRADLQPLEEAEGYRELMQKRGITAEAAATLLGISRTLVYNRLKLLDMSPELQAALDAGQLDYSKAMLLARLPGAKLQKKGLKIALDPSWRGTPRTHRELAEALRDKFMVSLDKVPFDLAAADLHPRGACGDCPNFSPNDPELQAEIDASHGIGARMCTDRTCHDLKVVNHFERVVEAARASGRKVITGDEAKALKPQRWEGASIRGYVDLDAECDEMEMPDDAPNDWRAPTYRALLGVDAPAADLFIDPHNSKQYDVVEEKAMAKLLKKRGIKYRIERHDDDDTPAAAPRDRDAERRAQEKEVARIALEKAYRARLLAQIHAKWKGPPKREDWEAIVAMLIDGGDEPPEALYGENWANLSKMSDADLQRLAVVMTVARAAEWTGDNPGRLLALAKRFRIDPVKVKKQVKAELEKAA